MPWIAFYNQKNWELNKARGESTTNSEKLKIVFLYILLTYLHFLFTLFFSSLFFDLEMYFIFFLGLLSFFLYLSLAEILTWPGTDLAMLFRLGKMLKK